MAINNSKKPRAKSPVRRSQRSNHGQRNIRQILHYEDVSAADNPTQQFFRFFDLPREIRNQIYGLLCEKTLVRFRQHGMTIGAVYGRPRRYDPGSPLQNFERGLPAWLVANKKILLEGLAEFHHAAEFFYLDISGGSLKRGHGITRLFSINNARIIQMTKSGVDFSIAPVTKTDEDGKEYNTFEFHKDQGAKLRRISRLLAAPSSLQVLTMDFYFSFLSGIVTKEPIGDIRFSVTMLDQLPKDLMKVTFTVASTQEDMAGYYRAWTVLRAGLERIARALVQSPGEECEENLICRVHEKPKGKCGQPCSGAWGLHVIQVTSSTYRRKLAYGAL